MRRFLSLVIFVFVHTLVFGQPFRPYPKVSYKAEIPNLERSVGHSWGEAITSYAEMRQYLRALSEASANVKMVEFGESWEGRKLQYLIVASEENLGRLDQIQNTMNRLADPRRLGEAELSRVVETLPTVVWLANSVHGNEISGTDAALLTAYHLAAAEDDSVVKTVLANCVVIIDPLQNPDGRERFVHYFHQTRGRWPDADQQAAEHNEAWPGGRTNHYLFDMNRDWFALTQPESRGRVQAFLQWYPQVFVDLHEMGSNATYYFPPPAVPYNPEMAAQQIKWLETFGKRTAAYFDKMGFDYFTHEIFDTFYPGYGDGWPTFQGALGSTFEQASTRGLLVKRDDETVLHYRGAVQHHFIASLATVHTAALHRRALLQHFYDYRKGAIGEGRTEAIREYLLVPGRDPNRVRKLVGKLMLQGIEVRVAERDFRNPKVMPYDSEQFRARQFPKGAYLVAVEQPTKHLVKTLLAKQMTMSAAFLEEQKSRHRERRPDQIYDVTGWSLPLLYGIEAYRAGARSEGSFKVLDKMPELTGAVTGGQATVAYLVPWGTNSAARALAQLFRQSLRVYSADKSFELNGRTFPRGSLIIKVKNNPADLHGRLSAIAEQTGVDIVAANSSWVESGINFGSNHVKYLQRPRVAMAYAEPTSPYSVGWTRYLLEQEFDYPVTIINTRQLGRADLTRYNVLILPNSASFYGSYKKLLGESFGKKLKNWLADGGTLITIGQATAWLTDEKVGLLATHREYRGGEIVKTDKNGEDAKKNKKKTPKTPNSPFDLERALLPEKELPATSPGALLRVRLDAEHWLASGYDGRAAVMVNSRNIFRPLKLNRGRNIALYEKPDRLLLSGFIWEENLRQLSDKAYLMYQPHGRGHVVAFAEDPNFRGFMDGLNLLFMNAVFFGPGH